MPDYDKFKIARELVLFMENEKEKYPNLIKYLKEQFKHLMK